MCASDLTVNPSFLLPGFYTYDDLLSIFCRCVVQTNTEYTIIPIGCGFPTFDKASGNWRGCWHELLTFLILNWNEHSSYNSFFRVYVAPSRSQYPRGIRLGEHPKHCSCCHAQILRCVTVVNGLPCGVNAWHALRTSPML